MSANNLARMAGILVVLILCSIIIPKIVYRSKNKKPYQSIAADQLIKIVINADNQESQFDKKDNTWMIQIASHAYTADGPAVTSLIDSVKAIELSEIVSSNPERHAKFDVAESAGPRVRLFTRGAVTPAVDFHIGKSLPDYLHFYFRFEGKNDVYASAGFSSYMVKKQPQAWRSRVLGAANKNAIDKIVVEQKTQTDVLTKDNGKWYFNGKLIDDTAPAGLIDRLASLTASDVVAAAEEAKISDDIAAAKLQPEITETLTEAGADTVLKWYAHFQPKVKDPDKYFVIRSNETGIFIVYPATVVSMRDDLKHIQDAALKPAVPMPVLSSSTVHPAKK